MAGRVEGKGERGGGKQGLEEGRRWRTQGVEGSRIVRVVIDRRFPVAIRAPDEHDARARKREREREGGKKSIGPVHYHTLLAGLRPVSGVCLP